MIFVYFSDGVKFRCNPPGLSQEVETLNKDFHQVSVFIVLDVLLGFEITYCNK